MAGEIATAYVTILPSFSGGAAAISSQLNGPSATAGTDAGKKFGGGMLASFKGFVGPLAAVAGGAAVFGFLKDAEGDASDLNETVSKAKVIFGDQFAAIDAWSKDSATALGLPRQAALDLVAGFGDMFTQLGFGGDVSAKMAEGVATLAADLGSFNNLPTEDVAQRIAAAFRGEYDSLQTLIPNINAARVEQQALGDTGKTSAKDLTAAEKAAAVLAIVNADGAKAAGDFARTSEDNANKQKILTARFSDMKAMIGQKLLPVMGFLLDIGMDIIDFFTGGSDAASGFSDVIGKVVGWVKDFITGNKATFEGWWQTLQDIFGGLKTLVETVVGFITDFWTSHGQQIMDSVRVVWDAIKTIITSALDIIKNIIKLVIDVVTGNWSGAWDAIKNIFKAAWDGIVAVLTGALEVLKTALTVAWAFISSALTVAWDGIKAALSAAWDAIKGYFDAGVEWIKGIPARIVAVLTGLWMFIATEAGELKDAVVEKFLALVAWVSGLPKRIWDAIGDLGDFLVQKGVDLVQGLIDGMASMFDTLRAAAGQMAGILADVLPGSPVKTGPLKKLNGGYAGGEIVRMIAAGMLSEQAALGRAAGVIAGAAGMAVPLPRGLSTARLSRSGDSSSSRAPVTVDARQITYNPIRRESADDHMQNLTRVSAMGVLAAAGAPSPVFAVESS